MTTDERYDIDPLLMLPAEPEPSWEAVHAVWTWVTEYGIPDVEDPDYRIIAQALSHYCEALQERLGNV